jgi:hypothetical protein
MKITIKTGALIHDSFQIQSRRGIPAGYGYMKEIDLNRKEILI